MGQKASDPEEATSRLFHCIAVARSVTMTPSQNRPQQLTNGKVLNRNSDRDSVRSGRTQLRDDCPPQDP